MTRLGFTLMELLTVVTIIAVLATMLTPVIGMVRDQAKASQCASNMRQLAVGFGAYALDNEGLWPYPAVGAPAPSGDPNSFTVHFTGDAFLTYIEESVRAGGGFHHPVLRCPAARASFQGRLTHYACAPNRLSTGQSVLASRIKRPGETVLLKDCQDFGYPFWRDKPSTLRPFFWTTPAPYPAGEFGSLDNRHNGAANFLFGDLHMSKVVQRATRAEYIAEFLLELNQ